MKIEIHSPAIGRKEMEAVLAVLVEEKIGPGEQSQRLLQAAKEKLQFDYALSLRSPAIALSLALKSFKSGVCGEAEEKRGVLISALSPRYYLEVLNELGLEPVICDVDGASASISVESARSAIENSKNGVFCAVIFETLGFMPEAGLFEALGVPIIEDCSLSFGSMLEGRQAGSFGTLSILGLEERDMLTSGGGAILFAMERRNAAVLRGFSSLPPEYGLPDMNAAMAFVQIREYKRSVERLNEIERLYKDAAMRGGRHKLITRPDNFEYNNYAFPLALESGIKDVIAYAKKKEINVENPFERSIAGGDLPQNENCPAARSLALRTVLFPMYPRLGQEAAERVSKLIQTLP